MSDKTERLLTMILAAQIEQIATRSWAGQPGVVQQKSYSTCEEEAFDRIMAIARKIQKATSATSDQPAR